MPIHTNAGTIEHVGKVISKRERNGYDDSDFYALVETEDGTFKEIMYDTTRFGSSGYAVIDATPDVLARYKAHCAKLAALAAAHKADVDGHMPEKGRFAIVMGGRKYKGIIGKITWVGPNRFDRTGRYNDQLDGLRKAYGVYDIDLDCRTQKLSVRIQPDTGDAFFITADKIDVIMDLDID